MEETSKKNLIFNETIEVNDQENQESLDNDSEAVDSVLKELKKENKFLNSNLNLLREETAALREIFNKTNEELGNLKKPSLLVAEIASIIDENKAVIKLPNGNKFYCYVSKEIKDLQIEDSVLVEQKTLNVVEKINLSNELEIEKFVILEKPKENWQAVGGLKEEIQEIKEVIELPLKKPKLFEKIGIQPPKGMLLHGPPGTGKTLLAKAVANSTKATFIEVVGSELVQKFIGEGAKLVKEIFHLARKKSPAIVFIDEIDALAATRMDLGTSGEREVNRTFMQLLAEMDGFKHLDKVKIIGATNRIDILDKAIIRPGRLDRLIEIGLPSEAGRLEILKVHTQNMNLENVKLKELTRNMGNYSGAEIKAVCTEAGYFAIRENRSSIVQEDFLLAIEKVNKEEEDSEQGLFG